MKCESCEENVNILIPAPLVAIPEDPMFDYVDHGDSVLWAEPNCVSGLTYWDVVVKGDAFYLRHYEIPYDELCVKCWDGSVWPSLRPHIVNTPKEMSWDEDHPWREVVWTDAK